MWIIPNVLGETECVGVNLSAAQRIEIENAAHGADMDRQAIYAVFDPRPIRIGEAPNPAWVPLVEMVYTGQDSHLELQQIADDILDQMEQGAAVMNLSK